MYPILFHAGPYPVYTYAICILLGIIILMVTTFVLARRAGGTADQMVPIACGALVGGFVGARLSHLMVEPAKADQLLDFYRTFQTITPGNVVGVMIGGYFGGLLVQRRLDLPPIGNHFAFGLAGAGACWRVGCTCGGCCYGVETDLPWAIHIDGANRHPTMVYEGVFHLLMLGVLWWARPYFRKHDELLFLYIGCYAGFRFWLEFLRLYPKVAFGLTGIQVMCLAILIWYAYHWRRSRWMASLPEHAS